MSRPATAEEITTLLTLPTPELVANILAMAASLDDLSTAISQLEAADTFDDVCSSALTPQLVRLRELIGPTVRQCSTHIVRGRD